MGKLISVADRKTPMFKVLVYDVVDMWTFVEINPFISSCYTQKISLRKGDYAGQGGGSWYS
ncbi:hypothetical protein CC062_06135 [Salmonella enterica]|nr:hypothetical protein [Salmonella enterica]ECH8280009.1 hypothetical protein [Salmonella enterica subsp. enterica]EAM9249063.1 hypothetical protein [Salmonella enterica]EAP0481874.1 hypothetical protein [Salmonella enterica]EAP0582143.1 hypothetical protein [Salmonella enterica]